MLRLSFIVPFYGMEKYIEECIRSLYNQDIPMGEYEVICVDDCSPDGSRAIVERLQKDYPTLRLLTHTENKRQGGARNTGLREAKGRYIWFVDSDDYIKPNCLGNLLDQAEKNDLEILKFYYESNHKRSCDFKMVSSSVKTGTELIFDVDTREAPMEKCCTVWCQLIKRDLIEGNNIMFAERVQYEDDDFMYLSYAMAKRVMLIGDVFYFVRETPNSTTRRKNDLRRAKDMYAQAIRYTTLAPKLELIDRRWENLSVQYVRELIANQIFRVLKDCSFIEQLCFWTVSKCDVKKLKPFLTPKTYAKLCSFVLWKLL